FGMVSARGLYLRVAVQVRGGAVQMMGALRVGGEDDAERSRGKPAKIARNFRIVRLTAGEHHISVELAACSERRVDVQGEVLGVAGNVVRRLQPARPLHR